MKKLILITIAILVSLITISQESTSMEKLFFQKVSGNGVTVSLKKAST
jgi:hypothetical protein